MVLNNKKASSITDPFLLILIVVIIGLFSFGWLEFGRDLASNPNNNLNNESLLYIYNNSGFKVQGQTFDNQVISSDDTGELFFVKTENDTVTGNPKDFALEFQYYREQSSSLRTIVQDVWNIPYFFVSGLGLNLGDWDWVINGLNVLIWFIILFAVYKFIRSIIR